MSVRTLALPTIAASTLLVFCGCALPAAASAAPVPAPAAAAAAPVSSTPAQGAVIDAPAGTGDTKATIATPTDSGAAAPAPAPALTLSSYDASTGKAVLTTPAGKPADAAKAAADIRPGQLIDSPPTAGAPHGALVAVTGVQQSSDNVVTVTTRPATLPELLGKTDVNLKASVSPASISVQPLVKDLKVAYNVTGITGGNGSVSGGLGLSANTTVPLSDGSSATLAGSVELNPTVDFNYQGGWGILAPQTARVGFKLGAHADWRVGAKLKATGSPIKIPIATLKASPVVWVGVLPVVVNLNFTVSAAISADGTVTVDSEQRYDGSWGVHSDYVNGRGWTTTTDPSTSTVTPVKLNLVGNASVKSGLEAQASVALYDAVGVRASVQPYLRTVVKGSVVLDGSAEAPVIKGSAKLYGGLDVKGELFARIAILGTTLAEQDLPFLNYHREWPIQTWQTGAGAAPLDGATAS